MYLRSTETNKILGSTALHVATIEHTTGYQTSPIHSNFRNEYQMLPIQGVIRETLA
jgi:hypothetical protein